MNPSARNVLVCRVCELDWDKHIKQAKNRQYNEFRATLDTHEYRRYEEDVVQVQLIDCIEVLKRVNEGPLGYTGAMGAQGIQGPSGNCSCNNLIA